MRYYLGIDNGSSSVKAALYDELGGECGMAKRDIPVHIPYLGYYERDMETIWQANCEVIREVLESSGISSEEVAAVACCGHGKGLYLWGEQGAVYPGLLSSDTRALSYVEEWKKNGIEEKFFLKTQQHMMACHPAALLCWFRDHKPEVLSGLRYVFTCKDYIRFRLTGSPGCEITEGCGMGFMNAETLQYDDEILKMLGLEKYLNCLPPIYKPTDICGYISEQAASETGLREGTPVAAGLFDIGASAIAVDAVDSENICMIAGTWSVNEYIRNEPVMEGSVLMNSVFCEPGRYLIEESSPTSAVNYQWYLSEILKKACLGLGADANIPEKALTEGIDRELYRRVDQWISEIPPEKQGPVFLPFVSGSNVHPKAQGAFVGLKDFHDIRHISRSVYEGVTFSHRYHLEKLLKNHPSHVREIHLAGGAANSELWMQMFADVCGYPVRVSRIAETGALGCAIVGAVASGNYPDIKTAIKNMVHLADVYYPNEERHNIYNRKYHLYQKTVQALEPVWDEFEDDPA